MIDGILTSIYTSITEKVTGAFAFIFNPLWRWYAIFALFLLVCCVLIWLSRLFDFAPMKWLRFLIGAAILLAGAFVAGGHVMYREQQAKLKAERDKLKKRPIPKPPSGNGPFGGWGT